jgi:rhodanese-related sulfurtransferase
MFMKSITTQEFINLMPNLKPEEVIVDVREAYEFEEAHLENSVSMPLFDIGKSVAELKNYKTAYLLCASGARSQYAAEILATVGITAVNVEGGLAALTNAGISLIEQAN